MNTEVKIKPSVVERFNEGYTEDMFKADIKCYHDALVSGLLIHNILHSFSKKDVNVIAYTALVKDEKTARFEMKYFDDMLVALGYDVKYGYSAVVIPEHRMSDHFEILAFMLNSGMVSKEEYSNLVSCDVNIL